MAVGLQAFESYFGVFSYATTPSIQKRNLSHRPRLVLRVHLDTVPEIKPDRGMVGMRDLASNVDHWVTLHHLPTPLRGIRVLLEQLAVLIGREPAGMVAAHVDRWRPPPSSLTVAARRLA